MFRRFINLFVICSALFFLQVHPGIGSEGNPRELQNELNKLREEVNRFQRQLNQAQSKKKNTRQKLSKAKSRENSILEIIERYNQELEDVRDRLQRLQERVRKARKKYRETREEYSEANSKLVDQKKTLYRRLRYAYMQRQAKGPSLLMNASDVTDFMTRMKYYREILKLDQSILNDFASARKTLKKRKKQRKKSLDWLKYLRGEVKKTVSQKEQIISKRKSVLNKIQNKKSLYRKKLRELENQQENLKNKVFRLQRVKSEKMAKLKQLRYEFGRQKGELPWPVESREIIRPFGEWKPSRTSPSFENDGIDIGVSNGTKVQVVAPGTVVFAKSYTGMGQVVIVRHGGGFTTLYGSLLDVQVERGDELEQGDTIGRAGETSGFREPRLYFQMFRGRTILDPTNWLK